MDSGAPGTMRAAPPSWEAPRSDPSLNASPST